MDNLDALVERLRFCAGPWSDPNLAKNASDAIRELRAELAQAVQTVRELGAVQATINAERDSLRAELADTDERLRLAIESAQRFRASLAAVEKDLAASQAQVAKLIGAGIAEIVLADALAARGEK